MLVIQRRKNERLLLDFDGAAVWVAVLQCDGGKVRLGITAPPEVRVSREELLPPGARKGAAETGKDGCDERGSGT